MHHKRWIYIAKAELAKGNWTLRDKAATVKTNIAGETFSPTDMA